MKSQVKTGTVLIGLFLFVQTLFALDYWIRVQTPVTSWLYRCAFTDTLNGWAVGDSGVIIHTSNGGNTWDLQNSHINFFIEEVFFLNPRLGWALANDFFFEGTTIIKTTNGGINWTASRYPDTTIVLYTVYYLDSLNGYMGGYYGVILKTSDAGNSWLRISADSSVTSQFPIEKFSFRDQMNGLAVGGIIDVAGVVWQTTNGGYNWNSQAVAPEPLYDVRWLDTVRAICTGGDFEYGGSSVRTSNKGTQWLYEPTNIFGVGQTLAFRTASEVWIPHGFSQRWGLSTDSANSWIEIAGPDTSSIYDARFIDPYHGWAVGTNGSVYKFNTLLIGNGNPPNNLPSGNKIFQNYPNPFNPSTVIKYILTMHTRVKITLFDMLGREVRVLLEDIKNPGEYTLHFNASGLSSGVYFYRIEAGRYTETRKMILIK